MRKETVVVGAVENFSEIKPFLLSTGHIKLSFLSYLCLRHWFPRGRLPQGIIWNPVKNRNSTCCCKSLIINPMYSLPLTLNGLGRRTGRDESEDLPMTFGPRFLQDYKAGVKGSYPYRWCVTLWRDRFSLPS